MYLYKCSVKDILEVLVDSSFLLFMYGIAAKIIAIIMAVTSVVAFLVATIIAFYARKRRNKSKSRRQGMSCLSFFDYY